MTLLFLVSGIVGNDIIYNFLLDEQFLGIRILMNLLIVGYWIYLIVIWSRKDKKTGSLVLLIVLNYLYTPFYYRSAVKKGWI